MRCVSTSAVLMVYVIACGDDDHEPVGAAGSGGMDAAAGSGGNGVGGGGGSGGRGGSGGSGNAQGGTDGSGGVQGGTGGSGGGSPDGAGGGTQGGSAGVDASAGADAGGGAAGGGGSSGATIHDDCTGRLDSATAQALAAGGPIDAQMKWLYPYDKTVFPRGLIPPVLQWSPAAGTPPNATYLRLHTQSFDYRSCFGPLPSRLSVPTGAWMLATSAASSAATTLVVELTTSANGVVSGPIVQTWTIAPASLKGVVFYNTYGSPQVGNNGAVMRLRPGAAQADPYLTYTGQATFPFGPCYSCHSLSANGRRMAAAYHQYPGVTQTSGAYDVSANANPVALFSNADIEAGFGALTPDGSRILTNGSPGNSQTTPAFPAGPGNVAGMVGPRVSRLFNAATGQQIQAIGWTVQYAKMPAFSADGRRIVFNDHDAGTGHSLAVMDFDPATNTFSNLESIYQNAELYPGWPFFTPDNKGVVFALGDASDYVSAHPLRPTVARSELYYVDLATKQAVRLSRAGGFDGNQLYLPYPGRDEGYDFFPTMSPVAAGGYFWVFFTSRRNYGNTIVGAADLATAKNIWVTAIDIGAAPGSDASHPAFYLPGQDEFSGNHRPFATLDLCKSNDTQCETGIECCCGACESGNCACPSGCSQIDEKCATTGDCCDASAQCIAGFCAFLSVP